jgi:hypothetical protein
MRRTRALATAATPNQQSYDVRWYDLDLTFTPAGSQVSGTVRVVATVGASPISTFDLDLVSNMVVDAVKVGGVTTSSTRLADVVTVNLGRAYTAGETVDLAITYHGTPIAGSFGYSTTNGRQLIWSLSEPYGARSWWPCKDVPEDKADSVTIRFTVPTGLVTASNGTRLSSVDNGINAVTRWRESHPIATYLVSIASYPYTVTTDWYRWSPTDSMRIDFHNYPESVASTSAVQAKVKTMLAAFGARFGPYPFLDEKYGHAQFNFGGGMEHQTCTSLGAFSEFVVAHELAHQWWGDLVTCRDFHEIWLNEGFATYSEALWAEATGGRDAYLADLRLNRWYGAGSVWVPNDQDEARIFDSNLSYDKGSWVLHMLRGVLGDSTFFAALARHRADRAYGVAATADFRASCEAVSGRDLTKFFQQWVYGEYFPIYRSSWASAPVSGGRHDVALTLEQRQSWQLFTMPITVRVQTVAGPRDFVVQDSLASQVFTLRVDAQPVSVEIDPDEWILRQFEYTVTRPSFDRSLLVVNGVDWSVYGTEITTAYADRSMTGDYTYDFWDCFNAPAAGYPTGVPAPLGRGVVPPEVLGRYRNVIWIGNHQNGDLAIWQQTPILSYLRAGGNVLLMSRHGDQFLGDSLRTYLGVNVVATGTTFTDCLATRPGFTNLTRTAAQSLCAILDTVRTRSDTHLLWKTTAGFTPQRGLGFIRTPSGGAGQRTSGGRFAFLSGRPYRWTHTVLKPNINTLLGSWFQEPLNGVSVDGPVTVAAPALERVRPDPVVGMAMLRFTLPMAGEARLEVFDAAGRRVRTLATGRFEAGAHERAWDGTDRDGNLAPAGLYLARLEAGGRTSVQRFVRLR